MSSAYWSAVGRQNLSEVGREGRSYEPQREEVIAGLPALGGRLHPDAHDSTGAEIYEQHGRLQRW